MSEESPLSYVTTSIFEKTAKIASGGSKEMILSELQDHFPTTLGSKAKLTKAQKDVLKDLMERRDELMDGPVDLSQDELDDLQDKHIQDVYKKEILSIRRRNREESDKWWKDLSKEEQEEIDTLIDEEFESTTDTRSKDQKLTSEYRAFRRAEKLVPITDEQEDRARDTSRSRGPREAREQAQMLKRRREEAQGHWRSLSTSDLTAAAIALDQGSILLTDNSYLRDLVKEFGGSTLGLDNLVNHMQEQGLLPEGLDIEQNLKDKTKRKDLKEKMTGVGGLRRKIQAQFNEDTREKREDRKQELKDIKTRRSQTREEYDQFKVDQMLEQDEIIEDDKGKRVKKVKKSRERDL
jgi:predicted nucleic acid-binding protein